MKILITGGTGFIGSRLVSALSKEGHSVTVYTRDKDARMPYAKVIHGDIMDYDKLMIAIKGHDAVYHLAAIIDETADFEEMKKVNVEGTRKVLKACVDSKVKRFVFASSVGVMGAIKNPPANESYPYNPQTNYEITKCEAEKLVLQYGLRHNLFVTVMRPSIVVGANDNWKQIIKAVIKRYPYLGSGNNHWHIVDIDDAVSAFVLALNLQKSGEIYIIASSEASTYKETVRMIADILGIVPPGMHVPIFLAKALFSAYESLCKITGKKPSLTYRVSSVNRLTRERYFDISKARKDLGYNPKYGTKESLKKAIEELQEKGAL